MVEWWNRRAEMQQSKDQTNQLSGDGRCVQVFEEAGREGNSDENGRREKGTKPSSHKNHMVGEILRDKHVWLKQRAVAESDGVNYSMNRSICSKVTPNIPLLHFRPHVTTDHEGRNQPGAGGIYRLPAEDENGERVQIRAPFHESVSRVPSRKSKCRGRKDGRCLKRRRAFNPTLNMWESNKHGETPEASASQWTGSH
ncbi:hypothetical protein EYF80_015017 [Liparis tanakae]|uniref:Uncharacterized protein n=1 Tax=Liparis tanakae TaxID=230148 RepID=A0A4Z2I9D7_9TELE|nr:hypothetical protein EYF80_015017 [Liparis tanakae]